MSVRPERLPRKLLVAVEGALIDLEGTLCAAHGQPIHAQHELLGAWLEGKGCPSRAELRAELEAARSALNARRLNRSRREVIEGLGHYLEPRSRRSRKRTSKKAA